ncbi:MAG: hypothetical protein HY514_00845 [Candidatus Aenigmarchaeota archaeon]|nr:hypothetical protein [Candidatus Aenigmarchaeota archaeon]
MRQEYSAVLEKFSISPTAAKVYLALLDLGKASADAIAKRAGTYKANVYDALDRLIEAGMATYITEGRKKLYTPTSPEKLIQVAEESKQKELEKFDELEEDIKKIMPQLSAKYNSVKEKDIFEMYKGKKGYRAMILDVLRENPRYWKGFGNLQVQEFFQHDFRKWFKNTKFMLFSTKSEAVLKRLKEARKCTRVKIIWLPEELYMPVVWTLFGNNLLIIIYEPDIIAFRMKSDSIVKTFSNQFDYLWKKHSEKNKA